jgi:uncharacterized protein (DUF2147 family)
MIHRAAALVFAALTLAAPLAHAEDVDGVWRTQPGETGAFLEVEVGPCADDPAKRCGVIARGAGERAARLAGRQMIFAMAPDGKGGWGDGEIWAPDDDRTYAAGMRRKGEALEVEGCVLIFCRAQLWSRVR